MFRGRVISGFVITVLARVRAATVVVQGVCIVVLLCLDRDPFVAASLTTLVWRGKVCVNSSRAWTICRHCSSFIASSSRLMADVDELSDTGARLQQECKLVKFLPKVWPNKRSQRQPPVLLSKGSSRFCYLKTQDKVIAWLSMGPRDLTGLWRYTKKICSYCSHNINITLWQCWVATYIPNHTWEDRHDPMKVPAA